MGFFKAYDMRGTFGVDFDLELVEKVGYFLPSVVKGDRWLIGRDCRTTSPAVHAAFVSGLAKAGVEVSDLGLCTTPMVYYYTAKMGFDGSAMITASHNPPSDNGIKISKKTALPVGYATGLADLERLCKTGTLNNGPQLDIDQQKRHDAQAEKLGTVPQKTGTVPISHEGYVEFLKGYMPDLGDLRIGIDCSNGMAALIARRLFPSAVIINETLDGAFPCHNPNPLKAEAREQISALVREKGLDLGIIFDGDADRAMFVDGEGRFIQPDYLIPIVAKARANGGGKVLHDVRTSRGATESLKEMGFDPVMVPVGHAFAKPKMRETGAVCGGELAGHYYFRDFFGCDSGFLAAISILGEAAKAKATGMSFADLVAPVSSRYANSGEINFDVSSKETAMTRALAAANANFPKPLSESRIDGVRIDYAEGWFNIRASNTENCLRLVAECDTKARLDSWLATMKRAIAP